jgi:hypothetical protein
VIIRDHVKAVGESMEQFLQTRVTELLKIVSEEIPEKNGKNSFRERVGAVGGPRSFPMWRT